MLLRAKRATADLYCLLVNIMVMIPYPTVIWVSSQLTCTASHNTINVNGRNFLMALKNAAIALFLGLTADCLTVSLIGFITTCKFQIVLAFLVNKN